MEGGRVAWFWVSPQTLQSSWVPQTSVPQDQDHTVGVKEPEIFYVFFYDFDSKQIPTHSGGSKVQSLNLKILSSFQNT